VNGAAGGDASDAPPPPADTAADQPDVAAEEATVEENSTDRLLTLSDGVFAVAITLLVLDIKVPHPSAVSDGVTTPTGHAATTLLAVFAAFLPVWPALAGYVLSFVTIGIMWTNHCVLFRYIKRNDSLLTAANSLLLLIVAFVPFVTAVLSEYLVLPAPYPQAATLIYAGTNCLMAVAFNLLWNHAARDYQLLDRSLDPRLFDHVTKRYRYGPLIYAICFVLGFVNVPLTLSVIALLAIYFALPYGEEERAIAERVRRWKVSH